MRYSWSFDISGTFGDSILSFAAILPSFRGRMVIFLGVLLRFNMFSTIFLFLCIAERTFQQRLLYAKYFFSLTSGRRARKYHVPQFRLNKLRHIKCWLTLRSYLKKRGPQRSIENIIVASFYVVFVFGLALGSQLISKKNDQTFSRLINLDMLGLTLGIALFQHRFLVLGTKITKKYRNLSIIITEQINLYLSIEKKPYKKDDFLATFQVLRLVEGLLKEVDGPFRICGWTVNPLVYNVFKLVLLSCFSTILSDAIGFKLKLHKLKLNAANW
ncbi:putative homeodomain transcription factor (Phtf) [Fasciolopsis buskii]|uniref:Putative homeodomain transcription factor (Phtf) n=1 Tax=Fasciolopsis buskii TaxID=27845 RepID=A0A8E0RKT0_9TREM|nr:putative homeodomain transcription factor (Phtf) [Fasciolopsis buski]